MSAVVIAICLLAQLGDWEARTEHFEKRVRPLLVESCYECHSGKAEKLQAGLRLDSREAILAGGDSGPAIIPGKADASVMVQAVRYESLEMPPSGKLKDHEIAAIVKWVDLGAAWPKKESASTDSSATSYDWENLRSEHWSFRIPRKPQLPPGGMSDWPRSGIDRFILKRLRAAGLRVAAPADRRTLIRRAYFDLIGLPPTPDQSDAFVSDSRPDAYVRLIERLLASPQYGERWARHWLDVARYSDGLGAFVDSATLPHAYRFRDWVVRALNRDLPYDDFVRYQVAGDLLNVEDSVIGPGFFAIGPTYRSDGGDPESIAQAKSETLDDRIDTFSRAFLALTVSCARCHDHKFDPIPTLDYYSIAGVFNNTNTIEVPLAPQEVVERYDRAQAAIKTQEERIKDFVSDATESKLSHEQKEELASLRAEQERMKRALPPKYPTAHSLSDNGATDMKVALRGNLQKPGPVAPRRFFRILAGDDPPRFTKGSGRLELAAAIANPRNPLTARVIVNRVWMHHFGHALVRTPSNFGSLGEVPTHPELLDWLASVFVESGWSIKSLHRTIMLSAAYQMSSDLVPENFRIDSDNRLIWRMNPRRLDVEAWRDGLLAACRELDLAMGGPPTKEILSSRRRTIYSIISRNGDRFESDSFLRLFDFPNARSTSPKRTVSIVPQQFLFMLNNPFMVDRARAFARRMQRELSENPVRIRRAYALLYGREPNQHETRVAQAFLVSANSEDANLSAWEQYAQVLLSTNEFLYIR